MKEKLFVSFNPFTKCWMLKDDGDFLIGTFQFITEVEKWCEQNSYTFQIITERIV